MSTKKIQVIGSMVPQSDWAQIDESKVDYIKNKPELGELAVKDKVAKTDLTTDVQTSLGKADTALQSYTETDPTVPAWAKASVKPTYTANEVGAEASGTVSAHNSSTSAHNDIRTLINDLTTRLNTLANSDDTTLDQMSEIVAYIKSNKSLIDNITTNKVNVSDVINLLTSDDTKKPLSAAQGKALKALIDALQSSKADGDTLTSHTGNTTAHITSAERTNWNAAKTHADSAHNYAGSSTKGGSATSAVKLDSSAGSATKPVYFKDGKPVETTYSLGADVPSGAKFTDTVYTHPTTSGNKHIPSGGSSGQILRWSADGTATWGADNNTTYSDATTSASGLMSASDKTKLNGIETGANKTTVDTAMSSSSTNPVQNKVVNSAIQTVQTTANEAKALAENRAPAYTYGTTDLTAGSSSLTTGTLYFVYE